MKKKVREELKLKNKEELGKLLKNSEDLLFKLRLDKAQNKLKNQRQIFWERKKIALMLTFINEKNRNEELSKKEIKKISRAKAPKENEEK